MIQQELTVVMDLSDSQDGLPKQLATRDGKQWGSLSG